MCRARSCWECLMARRRRLRKPVRSSFWSGRMEPPCSGMAVPTPIIGTACNLKPATAGSAPPCWSNCSSCGTGWLRPGHGLKTRSTNMPETTLGILETFIESHLEGTRAYAHSPRPDQPGGRRCQWGCFTRATSSDSNGGKTTVPYGCMAAEKTCFPITLVSS